MRKAMVRARALKDRRLDRDDAERQAHIDAHASCWRCDTCGLPMCPSCDPDGRACNFHVDDDDDL